MQENTTIARPYARAVFELAHAENDLGNWSAILNLLSLVVSDPAMQAMIKNPRIDHKQLAAILIDVCGENLNDHGRNFVKILVDAGRLTLAPVIRKLFDEKKAGAEGIAEVEVVSAYPLDAEQQEKIKQVMARRLDKKVEISAYVDESLIGGAVIRSGDSVIDASLRGRLLQLGHNLAE